MKKNKEKIQNIKETGDSRYIYQNELDKACFQHHMEILKICLEKKLLTKYYVIKQLVLLKIPNLTDINAHLLQRFRNFMIKLLLMLILLVVLLKLIYIKPNN